MNIVEEQMEFLYESTQKTFRKIPVEEEKDKMVEAEIEQIQLENYQEKHEYDNE
jgi:hypothetical protein